jgi:hypothetical protein
MHRNRTLGCKSYAGSLIKKPLAEMAEAVIIIQAEDSAEEIPEVKSCLLVKYNECNELWFSPLSR